MALDWVVCSTRTFESLVARCALCRCIDSVVPLPRWARQAERFALKQRSTISTHAHRASRIYAICGVARTTAAFAGPSVPSTHALALSRRGRSAEFIEIPSLRRRQHFAPPTPPHLDVPILIPHNEIHSPIPVQIHHRRRRISSNINPIKRIRRPRRLRWPRIEPAVQIHLDVSSASPHNEIVLPIPVHVDQRRRRRTSNINPIQTDSPPPSPPSATYCSRCSSTP